MPQVKPEQRDVVFVVADDWEGLYVDGALVTQGHSLPPDTVLQALGIHSHQVECDDQWLADRGGLPNNLSEVKRMHE